MLVVDRGSDGKVMMKEKKIIKRVGMKSKTHTKSMLNNV